MYSTSEGSRGLKASGGYSLKPLISTSSERSRPPKNLVFRRTERVERNGSELSGDNYVLEATKANSVG